MDNRKLYSVTFEKRTDGNRPNETRNIIICASGLVDAALAAEEQRDGSETVSIAEVYQQLVFA